MAAMSLNSSSTRDDAIAEIKNTLGWRDDTSGALARRFVIAVNFYILVTPANSLTSQRADTRFQTQFDHKFLVDEKNQAAAFAAECVARSATSLAERADVPRQISLERIREVI